MNLKKQSTKSTKKCQNIYYSIQKLMHIFPFLWKSLVKLHVGMVCG